MTSVQLPKAYVMTPSPTPPKTQGSGAVVVVVGGGHMYDLLGAKVSRYIYTPEKKGVSNFQNMEFSTVAPLPPPPSPPINLT